jgi:tetratricopeptide (TPR) repeat protein
VSLSPLEGENHIGSASKHTAASNNLVLTSFSSLKRLAEFEQQRISHAGLYQGITQNLIRGLNTDRALAGFASNLASVADAAYLIRQFDVVGYVGRLLLNLPLSRRFEGIGDYYQALSLNQGTRGDTVGAGCIFDRIADSAPLKYRARAMLALGANFFTAGDRQTAMSFYLEVMRIVTRHRVSDPMTLYTASRMTAVIKGMEDDHRGAVADLEAMVSLARTAGSRQPYAFYDYLNTLAVELGELGRLDQARRASEIAIASPFARAYPEWRETFKDIEAKSRPSSRSIVGVRQTISETDKVRQPVSPTKTDNLLRLPAPEPRAPAGRPDYPQDTQARVLNFQQWKTAIKASNRAIPEEVTPEQRRRMTTGEKLIRLMDLISQDETDDETIDRILEAVEEIVLNRRDQKLD